MRQGDLADPINRRILHVAEDQMVGFYERPFEALAALCGLPEALVLERVRAMLAEGTILRVRQVLPSTTLTRSCLIAWRVPEAGLDAAFDWLAQHDPATGHIVIRRAHDTAFPGAAYRLWTTLRLPAGADFEGHCRALAAQIHAPEYVCMPVVGMFTLSVGHVRRAGLAPGTLLPEPPKMQRPPCPELSAQELAVLAALQDSLRPEELQPEPWVARAQALSMAPAEFCRVAQALVEKRALGRFAAVLNHTLPANPHSGTGKSALFVWAVEPGYEEAAGALCGRHVCMTHCYWRSGGEPLGGVQVMGVAHAPTTEGLLAHKEAIDSALRRSGIPLRYTTHLYTERALVKPSRVEPR